MCYSPEVSLRSFIIANIGCVFLWHVQPVLALFFAFVSLMQLYDFIFWKNQSKNIINAVFTKVAMITNHLQPIIFALLIMKLGNQQIKPLSKWLTIVYTLVAIVYTILYWNWSDYTLVTPTSRGSLHWKWNNVNNILLEQLVYGLFLATLLVLAYQHFETPLNYFVMFLFAASFFMSLRKYDMTGNTGRFWCNYASYLPVITLVIVYVTRYVKQKLATHK